MWDRGYTWNLKPSASQKQRGGCWLPGREGEIVVKGHKLAVSRSEFWDQNHAARPQPLPGPPVFSRTLHLTNPAVCFSENS